MQKNQADQYRISQLQITDASRSLVSKILDNFVEKFRLYIVFKLQNKYQADYIAVAQGRAPYEKMKEVETTQGKNFRPPKINDNPESWDLSVLICLFHDHYDSVFSDDFPHPKAKATLLSIRDIRNKRAHDNPINAREAYRLADLVQNFFDSTTYTEVIQIFNQLRLEALELLVFEEKEKTQVTYSQLEQPHQQVQSPHHAAQQINIQQQPQPRQYNQNFQPNEARNHQNHSHAFDHDMTQTHLIDEFEIVHSQNLQ